MLNEDHNADDTDKVDENYLELLSTKILIEELLKRNTEAVIVLYRKNNDEDKDLLIEYKNKLSALGLLKIAERDIYGNT